MSQWKGPFKELHGQSLATGANDMVETLKRLTAEFMANAPAGTRTDALQTVFDGLAANLEAEAKTIAARHPFERTMLWNL